MPIIRNLGNFNNIKFSNDLSSDILFENFTRETAYDVSTLSENDFPEPLTGYQPNFYGTPISSPYWSDRSPEQAYQNDLLVSSSLSESNTHTPSEGPDNYTGFIFNSPTVSKVFVLKPVFISGKIHWPHRFYVIASNDGVNYETISPEYNPPTFTSSSHDLALYDINPNGDAFTEYRLRMIGNSFNSSYQYIDALFWY